MLGTVGHPTISPNLQRARENTHKNKEIIWLEEKRRNAKEKKKKKKWEPEIGVCGGECERVSSVENECINKINVEMEAKRIE